LTESDIPIIAARWLHFLSLAIVFGASLFSFYAVPRALAPCVSFQRTTDRVIKLCAYIALVSGVLWVAASIVLMADDPAQLLDAQTLADFFFGTSFGPIWITRIVLLAALAGIASALRRGRLAATRRGVIATIAALTLASQAWLGHAAMANGGELGIELGCYIVHVLAAGAWIGSLVPLAFLSAEEPASKAYARILYRFSAVAMGLVAAILVTGIANSAFRLDAPQALLATRYGYTILVKVCLFLVMLAIAAVNRWHLLPHVSDDGSHALRALRRNILAEQFLAALVLLVAAILGVLPPQI
jgi:putative copper resistance protein D